MNDIHYKLEKFEGPLHLLLEMIESEKLSVSEVALSQVTDQFLRHVEAAERENARLAEDPTSLASRRADRVDLETIVDFLFIASRLLYVKSKYVLSALVVPEEENEVSLEQQLKLFKAYQDASKLLGEVVASRSASFSRAAMLVQKSLNEGAFHEPVGVDVEKLSVAFGGVLSRLQFVIPRKEVVYAKAVSIRDKIDRIKSLIAMTDRLNFSGIVGEQATATDVVVSFLAMLEMAKQRLVIVEQEEMFQEISITRIQQL